MGPRGLLLSSKMNWLASVRWNWPQGRRGERVGTSPNRTAEKVYGRPGNLVIRALGSTITAGAR
jgi:hypothetical protein